MTTVEGWKRKTFKELGICIRGVSYKPGDLRSAPGKNTVTLFRSNNIRDGRLNYHSLQFVAQSVVRGNQRMQDGDIAICMSNGNRALVGKSGQFFELGDGDEYTVGAFCSIFHVYDDYDTGFVRHLFGSDRYQKQLDGILAGSAINNLKGSDIDDLTILCPISKPEQTKIAEILSTVDRVIEQTDALIAKQQRIKTGLMQDILTRGIDEYGNIRSEQTHKFKDSPLGRIPIDWEVATLAGCVRNDAPICYGILMPGTGFDNGVPVIKVKDISGGKILQDQLLLTDPKLDNQYKRSRLGAGDLLITIRGTTGRIALVPPELDKANITQDTARVRLKDEHSNQFFYFLLQGKGVQDQILLHTLGQAVKGINIAEVKKISFYLPRLNEQQAIAERLSELERSLSSAGDEQRKLRSLKTALMQDLLTGKKRVTPLLKDKDVMSG